MDRRRQTCRYLYVVLLEVHDSRVHLDVVSGEPRGHLQIRHLRIRKIRSRSCDEAVLVISCFSITSDRERTLDLCLDIVFWVVQLCEAET